MRGLGRSRYSGYGVGVTVAVGETVNVNVTVKVPVADGSCVLVGAIVSVGTGVGWPARAFKGDKNTIEITNARNADTNNF